MKRCSTCNRTYTDPNLSFCIDDGTPLTTINSEVETTVVSPRTNEQNWNGAAYQPPGSYVPPGAGPGRPRRRVWPWVLGIAGAFILGIVAISIAAAILVPRALRSARNQQREAAQTQQRDIPNVNTAPENANVSEPLNANANTNETVDVPPPTDREQVLVQLRDLENDWTVANINADKRALDRILADDYVGQASDGGLQSKADYIRTIERDTDIQKWEFDDLKVTLAGDRATLSGKITLRYQNQNNELVYDFTDKFVWRDGRWQATGSRVRRRE